MPWPTTQRTIDMRPSATLCRSPYESDDWAISIEGEPNSLPKQPQTPGISDIIIASPFELPFDLDDLSMVVEGDGIDTVNAGAPSRQSNGIYIWDRMLQQ
jgi:hypothetical protein